MTAGSLMAAELGEQPEVLGRLVSRHAADREQVRAVLPGRLTPGRLAGTVLLARGSSDNVAVYGRYLLEMATRRPAGLAAPSVHTRYHADVDFSGYLAVALSQSGATPEIVETAAHMRKAGAVVIGITNEGGSPLTEACDLTLLTDAGAERAVPATKTVTAQMLAVAAIGGVFDPALVSLDDLRTLPDAAAAVVADPAAAQAAAGRWARAQRFVVTGRGLAYAAALETALKVKESARVHAEGLSSADLLHGPIAALDSALPVLLVAGGERFAADDAALAERLAAVGVPHEVCGTAAGTDLPLPPGSSEVMAPILATIRGQQLALAASLLRGLDPDAPVGLSKVTATH
ncbi:MAG TPA: SIS domain-containing protein [Trebonia sp.]|jgi:glucosamine--fructose-6-phosphate aminotransferase (isomerizing)|nr:SIS domain-containing protein [Trebonia sp.]